MTKLHSLNRGMSVAAAVLTLSASANAQFADNVKEDVYSNAFGRPGYDYEYDYIVVGAGNVGAPLAARLAMDPAGYSVALLEAGSFYEIMDGNRTQIPGLNYINIMDFHDERGTTGTARGINTVPQEGLQGRELRYVTGHTFGGGTASNNMVYQRPSKGAMDWMAEILEDDFWNWENTYPAFKKSVAFSPPADSIDPAVDITYDPSAFDDNGGPLHISYGGYASPYSSHLESHYDRLGIEKIDGFNSGELLGYSTFTATIDARYWTRETSESSFIHAAALNTGLKLYPNAVVDRVTFDDNKVATGVNVKTNFENTDVEWHLTAKREVILSAGSWYSPQILMLSGIGPAEVLQEHGIEVLEDVPGVGQNVWDQPNMMMIHQINLPSLTQYQLGNPEFKDSWDEQYINERSGPLTGNAVGAKVAFEMFPESLRKDFSNATLAFLETFPDDWPEVEYVYMDGAPIDVVEGLLGRPIESDEAFVVSGAVLLSTASMGNMTIQSNDIMDPPLINPGWLTDDRDIDMAYAAFLRKRELQVDSDFVTATLWPAPEIEGRDTVIDWIRGNIGHIFHAVSTCKMGTEDDPLAVSDSRARVRGVSGLRVIDASSWPISPPGHPMSAFYMFGEKMAESILSGDA